MTENNIGCHPAKRDVAGRRKRGILHAVLSGAAAMGHGNGTDCADCVTCGNPAYVNAPLTSPDKLEVGHVTADGVGGCYGLHNVIPLCYSCNRTMRDTDADTFEWVYDPRVAYPLTVSNVPARGVSETRPMGTAAGRGWDGLVRR